MDINSINSRTAAAATYSNPSTTTQTTPEATTDKTAESSGVIYEKTSSVENDSYTVLSKENTALIAKLKSDAEQRTSQLRGIVEQMMQKQGVAIGNSDSMWSFLAKGDYTVTPEVKAQAEADVAEDGYWGVEQTSDRILDFAKAITNDDASKAEDMLEAFKEGFKEATKTWGDELPELSQRTYDAVIQKFQNWMNGTSSTI